jgi:hypothetical protein
MKAKSCDVKPSLQPLQVTSQYCIDQFNCGFAGPVAIADAIKDMGALSMLIFGGDPYRVGRKLVTPEPATLQLNMTEADLSNKNLGVGGAIIISAWLTHKDKGALTKLDARSNDIGDDGEDALKNAAGSR